MRTCAHPSSSGRAWARVPLSHLLCTVRWDVAMFSPCVLVLPAI
jgi:hypothetical protein